jgi:NADH dehydrogenase (ubiquinone) 1 alpha subcomplex subunit 9
VDRFVHVSSHNADKNSPSDFYRTKGEGEEIVRSIFPETTIVRPAPMFGWEDRLLNALAAVSSVFTSNHLHQKLRPVHVIDVGQALEQMLQDDSTASQTYELYGPKVYTMREISEIVDREIVKKRRHVNIPKVVRQPIAKYMNKLLWWPVGSPDQVEREFIDQVIDPSAKTFADLGLEPAELESLTFQYLVSNLAISFSEGANMLQLPYRSSVYYDLPPMTEKEKREEKKYLHVIDNQ